MQNDFFKHILIMPGVIGLALKQGRIINHFYLKDNFFSPEEKVILIRKIRSIALDKSDESIDNKYNINNYFIHYYNLSNTLILLVIENQEDLKNNLIINKLLKRSLIKDTNIAIDIFKDLTKTIYYSPAKISETILDNKNSGYSIESMPENSVTTIQEVTSAINLLSKILCHYLGEKITSNCWQLCRPPQDWLRKFEVKSQAKISYKGSSQESVSPLQHLWIREWSNAVIKECSQIIHDLPNQIDREFPDNQMRKYISIIPAEYLSHKISGDDTLFNEYKL